MGKLEIDELNAYALEFFRDLPAKYIPDHLPKQIETTKQMYLLEAA